MDGRKTDDTRHTHYPKDVMTAIPAIVRRAVLARAGSTGIRQVGNCEDCGERRPLDLHHLRRYVVIDPGDGPYLIDGYETRDDLDALCRACHYQRHRDPNGDYWWDTEEMWHYWEGFFH